MTKGKEGTIKSISRSTALKMSVGNFTAEFMSYSYLGKIGSDVTNRTLDSFMNPIPMETVSFGSGSGSIK